MRQIKIDTGSLVNIIDIPDESPLREPIVLKIELVYEHGIWIKSRAIRIIDVREDYLVIT